MIVVMDYSNLRKALSLPEGVDAPMRLEFDDFYAKPLTRADLDADLEGVNSSLEIIRETRGGSWPSGQISREDDLLDLAWHEREFNSGDSYAYVIYTNNDVYLGCFYLYGIGSRTSLTGETIDYDVDASWWVTSKAYEEGYYEKVYAALQQWLEQDFKFAKISYSNKVIPG